MTNPLGPSALPGSLLYRGDVMHKRMKPFVHELNYSVFSVLLDIDRLSEFDGLFRLFGHNRWAPVSIWDKDYGRRNGTPIREWIEAALHSHGLGALAGGPVRMLTFPRLWGYVFNPLTIHYCYAPDGSLGAILYEVSNTFGESHGYLIPVDSEETAGAITQETRKVFHVSPFIEMDCRYRFRIGPPGDKLAIAIHQTDSAGDPILLARHTARGIPLSDRALAGALLRHPLMTLKVIGGIHWEALRLWLKGARYYPKPPAPADHVTR